MSQDAMEGGFAKCTFANVFVAVEVGTKGPLRIIGVNDFDFGQAKDFIGRRESVFQALGSGDIEAGGEEMAGVEAVAKGQRGFAGREVADHSEFFETGPDLITGAHCVFEENCDALRLETFSRLGEAKHEGGDALFQWLAFVITRVENQVFGSDGRSAVQFPPERLNGFRADVGVEAGQVGQVVVVDDERRNVQPFASGAEAADIVGVRPRSAPHAGAGREDLKGIGSQIVRFKGGVFQGFRGRGVESDAQVRIVAGLSGAWQQSPVSLKKRLSCSKRRTY